MAHIRRVLPTAVLASLLTGKAGAEKPPQLLPTRDVDIIYEVTLPILLRGDGGTAAHNRVENAVRTRPAPPTTPKAVALALNACRRRRRCRGRPSARRHRLSAFFEQHADAITI